MAERAPLGRNRAERRAARGTRHAGKKPAVRGVYDRLKGRVGWNRLVTILGSLRERGLLLTKESHKKADPKQLHPRLSQRT